MTPNYTFYSSILNRRLIACIERERLLKNYVKLTTRNFEIDIITRKGRTEKFTINKGEGYSFVQLALEGFRLLLMQRHPHNGNRAESIVGSRAKIDVKAKKRGPLINTDKTKMKRKRYI